MSQKANKNIVETEKTSCGSLQIFMNGLLHRSASCFAMITTGLGVGVRALRNFGVCKIAGRFKVVRKSKMSAAQRKHCHRDSCLLRQWRKYSFFRKEELFSLHWKCVLKKIPFKVLQTGRETISKVTIDARWLNIYGRKYWSGYPKTTLIRNADGQRRIISTTCPLSEQWT